MERRGEFGVGGAAAGGDGGAGALGGGRGPRAGRSRLYVSRAAVHAVAEAALRRACADPGALAAGLAAAEAARGRGGMSEAGAARGRGEELRRELAAGRARLDTLLARQLSAVDPEERAALGRLEAQTLAALREGKRQLSALPAAASPGLPLAPSLRYLRAVGERFDGVWAATPGEERRALVNAVLAAIPVTVTPRPVPQPHRREVGPVVYQPWLAPYLGK